MAIQSKAAIIEQLSEAARRLKTVRERAAQRRDVDALGEPSAITAPTTPLQPQPLPASQVNRGNTP